MVEEKKLNDDAGALTEHLGVGVIENRLKVGPETDDYLFIVFSGGQCNFIDASGKPVHNPGREFINQKLLENNVIVFDPQIDVENNGRSYDYTLDGPVERKVRDRAVASLYELNSKSLGGVTFIELIDEATRKQQGGEPLPTRVIYMNLANGQSGEGQSDFTFKPLLSEESVGAHMIEYQKVAVNARNTFVEIVHKNGLQNMHLATSREEFEEMKAQFPDSETQEVTMDRLHGDRMMSALCTAKTQPDTHVVVFMEGAQKVNNAVRFLKSKTDMTALKIDNYDIDGKLLREKFVALNIDKLSDGAMKTVTDQDEAVNIITQAWTEHIQRVKNNANKLEHRIPPQKVLLAENLVYVGGAAWWRDFMGESHENEGRDEILEVLDTLGIMIYEAQARPSKGDKPYVYEVNHPADSSALRNSQVTVLEVNQKTAGGMTAMEALMCARSLGKEVILFANVLSDETLVFAPEGIDSSSSEVRRSWYKQATADAENMRNFFLSHAGEVNRNVKIYTDEEKMIRESDKNVEPVIISGSKLHIKELYEAFDRATRGEAVTILFQENTLPDMDKVDGETMARILEEYKHAATEIKQSLLKTAASLLNVTLAHTQEEVIEEVKKQWERRNIQTVFETPIGDIHVSMEDPILRGSDTSRKSTYLNAALVDGSPVYSWLRGLGIDKNPPIKRPGHKDIVPSSTLPVDTPGRLRLMNATMVGKVVRFAFGVYEYQRTGADGKVENLSRVIFFRPPAAGALPIIEVTGSRKKYIMLTRQLRDGAGGALAGEVPAGTLDQNGEAVQGMIEREMGEEVNLTQDELALIIMEKIHDPLWPTPGGDWERIAGFFCHMKLTQERMEEIARHSAGHDVGESVQTHFIELPEVPDDEKINSATVAAFQKEWDSLMEDHFMKENNDGKTVTLLQELRYREVTLLQNRLIAKLLSYLPK